MNAVHKIVLKHYPLRRIEGNGPFALISECDITVPIYLFEQASQRTAFAGLWATGCGAERCQHKHFFKTIRLEQPAPIPAPVQASNCWERD